MAPCTIDIRVCPAALVEKVRAQTLPRVFQPPSYQQATLFSHCAKSRPSVGSTHEASYDISYLPMFKESSVFVLEPRWRSVARPHWPAPSKNPEAWQRGDAHQGMEPRVNCCPIVIPVASQGDTPPVWRIPGHYSCGSCNEHSSTISVRPSHTLTSSFYAKMNHPVGDDGQVSGWWASPHTTFLPFFSNSQAS